jgi:hypothetical protein
VLRAVWFPKWHIRESIFLFSHTNELCGKSKLGREQNVAGRGLLERRRVTEDRYNPAGARVAAQGM